MSDQARGAEAQAISGDVEPRDTACAGASPIPVFVLGLLRSGTTWLANMLGAHSPVACVEAEDHHGIHESICVVLESMSSVRSMVSGRKWRPTSYLGRIAFLVRACAADDPCSRTLEGAGWLRPAH